MQEESLEQWGKLFIYHKIYIYENSIRIEHLSDLLRVSEVLSERLASNRYNLFLEIDPMAQMNKMKKYKKMFDKYVKYSDEEINGLVNRSIIDRKLDPLYYTFRGYNRKFIRIRARMTANQDGHFIKYFLWLFYGLINLAIIVPLIVSLLIPNSITKMSINQYISYSILALLCFIPWMLWTRKWMRPTPFEIKNGYDKE